VTLMLHSWSTPSQALALLTSPRLGLRQPWFIDSKIKIMNNEYSNLEIDGFKQLYVYKSIPITLQTCNKHVAFLTHHSLNRMVVQCYQCLMVVATLVDANVIWLLPYWLLPMFCDVY